MKIALAGLLLLCLPAAHAYDGAAALQWSDRLGASAASASVLSGMPELASQSALVYDQASGRVLMEKNAAMQTPIASITKLMTAVLVLNANLPLDEKIALTADDRDTLKGTGSRLAIGARYTRGQLLHLALIASDNRAAHALARTAPGGAERFVANMNRMARVLGMNDTVYVEPTGLSSGNQSTAHDLAKLVDYAYGNYPEIRQISSSGTYTLGTQRVVVKKKHRTAQVYYRPVAFHNTNRLTRMDDWHIGLSKTGFINEAGHCVVMQANVAQRDVIIVLLDAGGNNSRAGDATRIRQWLEAGSMNTREARYTPPASRM